MGVGSIALAQASLGAAATGPTSGMIFSPADVTRHGAAASPQPERPPARPANSATREAQRRIPVFMIASNQTRAVRVNALAPRHRRAGAAPFTAAFAVPRPLIRARHEY